MLKGEKALIYLIVLLIVPAYVSAATILYDDFSSGTLDAAKWDVRQDIESQPLTDEYGVRLENDNYVFHTQQNEIGDRRTYLVPKHKFGVGDVFEYDVTLVSGEGNHGNVNLLVGGTCSRCAFGVTAPGAIGTNHIAIIFESNQIRVEVDSNFIGNAPIGSTEHVHDLYIGAFSGHNGRIHMDFDNFVLTSPSITTTTVSTTTTSTIVTTIPVYSRDEVDALLAERDAKISALESRASLLETALSNIRNTLTTLQNTVSNLFTSLFGLPKGLRQEMICSSMKATNQTFAQGFGLTCSLNDKGACSCS